MARDQTSLPPNLAKVGSLYKYKMSIIIYFCLVGRSDLIGQFVPSLLSSLSSSSMPSTTVSSPSQSQDVLKTMYMYRVKQIQAFMQGLPADQKPRNLTELKDLLKKYNVNFQVSGCLCDVAIAIVL